MTEDQILSSLAGRTIVMASTRDDSEIILVLDDGRLIEFWVTGAEAEGGDWPAVSQSTIDASRLADGGASLAGAACVGGAAKV